jgi:hypothetical protein
MVAGFWLVLVVMPRIGRRRNSRRTERGIAEYLRQKAAAKDKAGSIGRVSEMKSLARTYECDANKLAEPRDGYTKEVSFVGYIL